MDADLCVKIFDTSTPTSHAGTSGEKGTGFGMPVVKSYMRLYGGDIEVRSWPQAEHPDTSGTEMTLIFKTAAAPALQAAA
jgi:signal transduction histidine kinase